MKKKIILSFALSLGLFGGNGAFAENYTSYTIQNGDTFWILSQKFNLNYNNVLEANPNINTYNLYTGLIINLPINQSNSSSPTTQKYTIQAGDTFWTISKKLNLNYYSVLAANPNTNPYNLYPGLEINVPVSTETTSYVIQSGDTFWRLAQKYNIPYAEILAVNPDANPRNLDPGLTINLPIKTTQNINKPHYLSDGFFPLKRGSYTPFTDTYGDGRSYNSDGTQTRKHEGVDIIAPKGTPIYSAYDGTVMNKGWSTLGGWRLTVKTPDGKTAFYYAHLTGYVPNIETGSRISKGQLIGYAGDTGYGPEGTAGNFVAHLHFGMYDLTNGFSAVNPYEHLKYWEMITSEKTDHK